MADITTLTDILDNESLYDLHKITTYMSIFDAQDENGLHVGDTDTFQVYYNYIKPYISSYEMTTDMANKYMFRPELLSTHLYGTPRLSWLLLRLNNCESSSTFMPRLSVNLITSQNMRVLYNTICPKRSALIASNWTEQGIV